MKNSNSALTPISLKNSPLDKKWVGIKPVNYFLLFLWMKIWHWPFKPLFSVITLS